MKQTNVTFWHGYVMAVCTVLPLMSVVWVSGI